MQPSSPAQELQWLVGDSLSHIHVGPHVIIFTLESGSVLRAEALVGTCQDGGVEQIYDTQERTGPWTFQILFQSTVTAVTRFDDRLTLRFGSGDDLILYSGLNDGDSVMVVQHDGPYWVF